MQNRKRSTSIEAQQLRPLRSSPFCRNALSRKKNALVRGLTRVAPTAVGLRSGTLLLLLVTAAGCEDRQSGGNQESGTADEATRPVAAPDFSVGPDTKGALYTWVDEKGSFQHTDRVDEIPESARKQVRVVVDGKSVGSAEYVYVADLTDVSDGKYSLLSMPRQEWENIGKEGREKQMAALRPKEEPSSETQLADLNVDAIIYGADWCKPCHLAEDYLKSRGARVIKKDIEEDPAAAREMQQVLRGAGLSGSSIPVLNVGGTILRGFSKKAIDSALSRSKK